MKNARAPYCLPAGCAALLLIGAVAAGTHGWLSAGWVLALAALVTVTVGVLAEPAAAAFVATAGWLTVAGFSGPPYGQLRFAGTAGARAVLILGGGALAGSAVGAMMRRRRSWARLDSVKGLDRRRQLAGVALVAVLPALTAALVPAQGWLSLSDDLLIYLVGVIAVAVVGGFWPAVTAAVTASMLLNWFFTPPVHTFTIADPQNMLALLLFVTVAVTVSSVVHLAARREVQATRSRQDAAALLALAQTVLGGDDTPAAIMAHLTGTWGGRAELLELAGGNWVRVACSGEALDGVPRTSVQARRDVMLVVAGQDPPLTARLLDGFAAQAAAALDRDRLRTQAAQAEVLAEGNRIRTALLAAVSHDLRTPLASIKASVSTLRQAGVELTDDDETALLATIESGTDRLNGLIGNLLDMSRLSTGSLQPLLRPTAVDEVAPLAHAVDSGPRVQFDVPDGLPLVRTDPGLLERILANLFANAVAHSPPGREPTMTARRAGDTVLIDIADHGRGVPDELKARMFEPFERLSDRPIGSGVGLGLTVAKGFAEAIGGSLAALDTPGGGLTMRLTLPIAGQAASAALT